MSQVQVTNLMLLFIFKQKIKYQIDIAVFGSSMKSAFKWIQRSGQSSLPFMLLTILWMVMPSADEQVNFILFYFIYLFFFKTFRNSNLIFSYLNSA